jgi:hypothetical protein
MTRCLFTRPVVFIYMMGPDPFDNVRLKNIELGSRFVFAAADPAGVIHPGRD